PYGGRLAQWLERMLHTHEVAGSSPAPPTSFDGEAPLRRLNPFPPRPLWGERVQGEGGACSWRMSLRPQGGCGGTSVPPGGKGGSGRRTNDLTNARNSCASDPGE